MPGNQGEGEGLTQAEEKARSSLSSEEAKSEQAPPEKTKGEEKPLDKNVPPSSKLGGESVGGKEMTAEMMHRQQLEYQRYR